MSEATTIKHLHAERRWVLWKLEEREGSKPTKIPYTMQGYKASSTNPAHWDVYADNVPNGFTGRGFVLGDGFVGVDIDGCVVDGVINPEAQSIIDALDSYTEFSVSGTGIHIICQGTITEERRKRKGAIEIYSSGRFFTMSGNIIGGRDTIHERTDALNAIIAKHLADTPKPAPKPKTHANTVHRLSNADILDIVRKSKQAQKFESLWRGEIIGYQSQSEAEMALADILAFYSDSHDQIDSLMRQSGLMREKWDKHKDYLSNTIKNALSTVTEKYSPSDAVPLVAVSKQFASADGVISTHVSKTETISPFWWLTKKETIAIALDTFVQFLAKQGFCKMYLNPGRESEGYEFVYVQGKIIKIVSPVMVKDYVIKFIDTKLPSTLRCKTEDGDEVEISSSDLRQCVIRSHKNLFVQGALEFLPARSFEMLQDDAQTAYVLYKNCIARVTKDGIAMMKYEDLQSYVWADSIRSDVFLNKAVDENAIFRRFVRNVCTDRAKKKFNEAKYKALVTAIGFLIHRYKNPAQAKAVFLTDEVISDTPEGRTGKGVLSKAIGYMRNAVRLDAKSFNFESQFAYQQIEQSTEIVEFNDVNYKFKFDYLFPAITDDMTINRKGKPAISLPFSKSPKFIISANFAIDSLGGSASARLIQIELSEYYSAEFTPLQEFGVMFWHEWGEEEQQQFHSYMLACLETYLDEGLIEYTPENLAYKTLCRFTHESFVDYMESELVYDTNLESKQFYDRFINDFYTGEGKYSPSASRFSSWIKKWCKVMKKEVEFGREGKSRKRNFIVYKGGHFQ